MYSGESARLRRSARTHAFAGDILALTSITLNTGATITCGAAWARNGAVTLDTNTISICALLIAGTDPVVLPDGTTVLPDGTSILPDGTVIQAVIGPAGFPLFAFLLPPTANRSQRAVASRVRYIDQQRRHRAVPIDKPVQPAAKPTGERVLAASGRSWHRRRTGGYAGDELVPVARDQSVRRQPPVRPAPRPHGRQGAWLCTAEVAQPPGSSASAWLRAPYGGDRSWGIWAAAYGGHNKTSGDPLFAGSHDRTARTFGFATGLDYLLTPYTVVGFALGGGGTNFGISEGYGVGRSDMFQASIYSITRYNAAYISAAIAYAWHRVSTHRALTVLGNEQLNADFSANSIGGRIEGGYRFPIPGMFGWHGFGLTPYAALQAQAFRTPNYREVSSEIDSAFALAYSARTTTGVRSELGVWFDRAVALDSGAVLALRTRAAWAHDRWSDPSITASFLALPGASFVEFGAVAGTRFPARLGQRRDQSQERNIGRRKIRQRTCQTLANLHRHCAPALRLVSGVRACRLIPADRLLGPFHHRGRRRPRISQSAPSTSSPLIGSMSILALAASARNLSSFIAPIIASRNALTRAAGWPGGET